jgi:choline dehydrogenase-like flavoprotein
VDKAVMAELVRFNRAHWARKELESYSPVEIGPGPQYQTDDDIMNASIMSGALTPTFAHMSGGCSMMPEELGGCVSDQLKVYGVGSLRVVDASVLPLIPACNLQATMYAVAEKAADIIKGK